MLQQPQEKPMQMEDKKDSVPTTNDENVRETNSTSGSSKGAHFQTSDSLKINMDEVKSKK